MKKFNKQKDSIRAIQIIIISGFTIAVIKNILVENIFNLQYPFNTFLFNPNDRFRDFLNMIETCKNLNPYAAENIVTSVYFPFANSLFYFFSWATLNNNDMALLLFMLLFSALFYALIKSTFKTSFSKSLSIFCCLLLSYPILFSLDRLNIELYLFLFLGFFLYYYSKEKYFISLLFLY